MTIARGDATPPALMPGRIALKLSDPDATARLPDYLEVRSGDASPSARVDRGMVDRVLRAHSPAAFAVRAFGAASGSRGGKQAWDAIEHAVGLSRTLRVWVDPETDVEALCAALRDLAVVESASPVALAEVPRPIGASGVSHPLEQVRGREALAFEPGDRTLIVAVVDSGVVLEHAELEGRLRPGYDTVDLPARPFGEGLSLVGDHEEADGIPRDEMGHGTACASLLAARGLDMTPGIAGAAWVLPMRALAAARRRGSAALTAVGATVDIDYAVKRAIDLGAKVLNLSFGTPADALAAGDPIPHADIVAYARARKAILVAASGNDGKTCAYYPAALEGVIAVGSVDREDRPSRFSTRGDHVALCAPGERVRAAGLRGYGAFTGTSFAAPFVAGACALLCARAARYGVPLTGDEASDLLRATARPFAAGSDVDGCGAGVLDAMAALEALERDLTTTTNAFARAGPSGARRREPPRRAETQSPAPPTR